MDESIIYKAKEHFGQIVEEQLNRVKGIKKPHEWMDYFKLKPIKIGILIGNVISSFSAGEAKNILFFYLKNKLKSEIFA